MPIFFVLFRTLPIIYTFVLIYLLFNILSSLLFGDVGGKEVMKRLFFALVWPLSLLSPSGRLALNYIVGRI